MEAQLRKCVKHESWKWLPGMVAVGHRDMPKHRFRVGEERTRLLGAWADALPDLGDPATVGCLQELVRRKYRDPSRLWNGRIEVHQDHRLLFCVVQPFHCDQGALQYAVLATGETEVASLINALCQG